MRCPHGSFQTNRPYLSPRGNAKLRPSVRTPTVLTLTGLWLVLAGFAAGCSPDAYKADADAQIQHILSERKETELGYQPQAVPETTVSPTPTRATYAILPTTPIPPPAVSPF